jgi:hypothetical protein
MNTESADKYFTLLLKAFRNLYNTPSWELSVDTCKEMLSTTIKILASKFQILCSNRNFYILFITQGCNEYGKYLNSPRDKLGSVNLNVRSIISKMKQKYGVDNEPSENQDNEPYVRLLYLKEVNSDFVQVQKELHYFTSTYFS